MKKTVKKTVKKPAKKAPKKTVSKAKTISKPVAKPAKKAVKKVAKKTSKPSKPQNSSKSVKTTKKAADKKAAKKTSTTPIETSPKTDVKKEEVESEDPIPQKKQIYSIKINKENITSVVSDLVGEDALDIVFYLRGKKDVSEFTIAEDTQIEIHTVRNILYRLNNDNLVSYIRRKDKIKGWYISYWTFLDERIPEMFYKIKEKRLNKFKERIEKEQDNLGNFYLCPNGCVRLDFDSAMDFDFKCHECGSLLNQQDNVKTIERLKESIEQLEKELKEHKLL
ncbi:hypothetical protein KY334_04505 [Candidatus Woesearchaeota archaeon]|nr:hypothetical protein [Candidatus Woesearchaeota archaeon]